VVTKLNPDIVLVLFLEYIGLCDGNIEKFWMSQSFQAKVSLVGTAG